MASRSFSKSVGSENRNRNYLINGDMAVAQRSTSNTSVTTQEYQMDRWQAAMSGLGTWTHEQSTDVPAGSGFPNSAKLTCTTADASPAIADYKIFRQWITGRNCTTLLKGTASAETIYLSFWVKSNNTGTYILEIYDADNTRSIARSFTVDVTDTWEYKTISFPGDTTGTLVADNTQGLAIGFWLGAGTNYTSGTLNTSWATNTNANRAVGITNLAASVSNYINFTGIQMETGGFSDFVHESFFANLHRCERYYQKSYSYGTALGTVTNAGMYQWAAAETGVFNSTSMMLPVEMIGQPTMRYWSTDTGTLGQFYDRGGLTDVPGSGEGTNSKSTSPFVNNTSTAAGTQIRFHWEADAEL